MTMHLSIQPLPSIRLPICILVGSEPVFMVVFVLTLVRRAIALRELTFALPDPVVEVADKHCPILPALLSVTVLQVVFPVSFVAGSSFHCEHPDSIDLISTELPLVHQPIRADKPATTVRLVPLEPPLVQRSVLPHKFSFPMFDVCSFDAAQRSIS